MGSPTLSNDFFGRSFENAIVVSLMKSAALFHPIQVNRIIATPLVASKKRIRLSSSELKNRKNSTIILLM